MALTVTASTARPGAVFPFAGFRKGANCATHPASPFRRALSQTTSTQPAVAQAHDAAPCREIRSELLSVPAMSSSSRRSFRRARRRANLRTLLRELGHCWRQEGLRRRDCGACQPYCSTASRCIAGIVPRFPPTDMRSPPSTLAPTRRGHPLQQAFLDRMRSVRLLAPPALFLTCVVAEPGQRQDLGASPNANLCPLQPAIAPIEDA